MNINILSFFIIIFVTIVSLTQLYSEIQKWNSSNKTRLAVYHYLRYKSGYITEKHDRNIEIPKMTDVIEWN
jgi:hypothetical protein